ncbi:putative protein Hikeshi [Blattamonas nauphoetae]|uniref:Hikeshi-like domain-containing protein n=1 Tax=Blattamonas nauphoetae TaxID=2049346 RepID=A0ABQ9X7Y8_9EUKA|nr:putative protein Hikeshi [Blattamonas nauphoetae]
MNEQEPITFCGIVLPGRPVCVSLTQVSEDKYLLPIENISTTSHVCVFLTGNPPLQAEFACAIYMSLYPFESWNYLGSVSMENPSTILRFRWPQDALDRDISAQLGIGVMSLEEVRFLDYQKQQERQVILNVVGDQTLNKIGQKVVENFYNYLQSATFQIPSNEPPGFMDVVPSNAVDRWMQSFDQRCRNNPRFWQDIL